MHDALLGCKNFNLKIVKMVADEIEIEYEYSLSYFYDAMEKRLYLEIIEPIRNTLSIFCKRIKPTLGNLKNYRDERLWVERSSTILAKKGRKRFRTKLIVR